MSHPLRSPDSAPLMLGGAVIALGGLLAILWFSVPFYLGMVVAVFGIAVEFSGAWLHGHNHRRRLRGTTP